MKNTKLLQSSNMTNSKSRLYLTYGSRKNRTDYYKSNLL